MTIPFDAFMPDPDVATQPEPEPDSADASDPALWAVVFAGGIGSRFWPLSTAERPKPLLALLGERPLVADTVDRLAPLVPAERVLVLTSGDIADGVRRALPAVPAANVLVEPHPLGTAAALAWGAHEARRRGGPEAMMVAMHADLAAGFPETFRATLQRAAAVAGREEAMVAVGVRPTRPEQSFGYVRPGRKLESGGSARWAAEFVEKPAPLLARQLIDDGALWHSGILVARARVVLDSLGSHTPELAAALAALAAGDTGRFAGMTRSVSIERGLLERVENLVVIPGDFGWDDVGTWACLRRTRELDDNGNGAVGPAHFVDSSANVVHAERNTVVVYGMSNTLVVALDGVTFVTTLDRARDLKPLLDALPGSMRMKPGG
jgi:mannose-1-phosphate guanylyltransferase